MAYRSLWANSSTATRSPMAAPTANTFSRPRTSRFSSTLNRPCSLKEPGPSGGVFATFASSVCLPVQIAIPISYSYPEGEEKHRNDHDQSESRDDPARIGKIEIESIESRRNQCVKRHRHE